jgi:hypothetical protein
MSLIATLVILGFLWREVGYVKAAWDKGHHPIWAVVGGLQAACYLIPLVAVWL